MGVWVDEYAGWDRDVVYDLRRMQDGAVRARTGGTAEIEWSDAVTPQGQVERERRARELEAGEGLERLAGQIAQAYGIPLDEAERIVRLTVLPV
jgi:hypothetical protein